MRSPNDRPPLEKRRWFLNLCITFGIALAAALVLQTIFNTLAALGMIDADTNIMLVIRMVETLAIATIGSTITISYLLQKDGRRMGYAAFVAGVLIFLVWFL